MGTDPEFQPVSDPLLVWLGHRLWVQGEPVSPGQGTLASAGRGFVVHSLPRAGYHCDFLQLKAVPHADPNTGGPNKKIRGCALPSHPDTDRPLGAMLTDRMDSISIQKVPEQMARN